RQEKLRATCTLRWSSASCGGSGPIAGSSDAPDRGSVRRVWKRSWMRAAWRAWGWREEARRIPRAIPEYRKLLQAAEDRKPDLALLTDSPDFHLRAARKLYRAGIPVVYLVAPQAWAWRRGRVKVMRQTLHRLLCIFPFEEPFFSALGVPATYI